MAKYQVVYRNKMFGYKAFAVLNKKFKSRAEAKAWIEKHKQPYIDKIKIEDMASPKRTKTFEEAEREN